MTRLLLQLILISIALVSAHAAAPSAKAVKKGPGTSVGEPPPDASPAAELASFTVLEGFKMSLFASEEDGVPNPLVLRWDERGRLWCVVTTAYPQPKPGEPCDDQVLILEDINHDGRMDKKTIFARGLRMPMGMELEPPGPHGETSILLGEGEQLLRLIDNNGDDQADQSDVIFSGFGTGDAHQNINSFIWSPDGSLVMHQGLHCYSRVTTPSGIRQLYGAGFWRYWPRSSRLEAYPTGMPQNAWGTAFDAGGQPIMVAGAAGMYWSRPMEISVPEVPTESGHGLPYFLLSRFMLPSGGQIIKTEGLRKFCGIDIVGTTAWPSEMQGQLICGGFFENAIHRYKVTSDTGAPSGMEAIEQPALVTSSSVAFRPVDVRFGPDGAVYIADWYDPIIGHYQASFRHPNRDKLHGRIWRLAPTNLSKPKATPLLSHQSSNDELLTDQLGSDRWLAYQAQRLIQAREPEAINKTLGQRMNAALANDANSDASIRAILARLQFNERREHIEASTLRAALEHPSEVVRAYATHTLGNWADALPNALDLIAAKVSDASPRVRLEAIVAAAKVPQARSIRVALKALDLPMDTFLDRALWLAVHAISPQWKPAFAQGQFNDLPPSHLAYLVEKEGSASVLDQVRTTLKSTDLQPIARHGLVLALARKGQPADLVDALRIARDSKQEALLSDIVAAIQQRGFKTPAGGGALLAQMLSPSSSSAQRQAACSIAGHWATKSLLPQIQALAVAKASSETEAAAAIRALGKLGASPDSIAALLASSAPPSSPSAKQIAALEALADIAPARAGALAAIALDSITDKEAMRQWLAPLLAREAATEALTKALNTKPCSPATAALAMQTLNAAGRSDASLSAALGKGNVTASYATNAIPNYDPAWVAALANEVKKSGNVAAGRQVFTGGSVNCTACHSIAKQGGTIGPELDAVGRGVPLELLIEAVTWPNRQIKEGYVATNLLTRDGRRFMGYKVSDANGELQLRDFMSITIHHFTAAEIKERQDAGSLMPEGLIALLTREELRDLIAYLMSLGK